MDDSRNNHHQAEHLDAQKSSSRRDTQIQAIIAVAAIAALVVSVVGLLWSHETATAANQLSKQAASAAAQSQESAQAREVSYSIYNESTSSGERHYVQIINLSTNNIRNVLLIYGRNVSSLNYYVNVDVIKPCSEWQTEEPSSLLLNLYPPFTTEVYFEDAVGNYWEMDSDLNLHSLSFHQFLIGRTEMTGAWQNPLEIPLSCAS